MSAQRGDRKELKKLRADKRRDSAQDDGSASGSSSRRPSALLPPPPDEPAPKPKASSSKLISTNSRHMYTKHHEVADSAAVFQLQRTGSRNDADNDSSASDSDDLLRRLSVADVYGSDEEVIDSASDSSSNDDDDAATATNAATNAATASTAGSSTSSSTSSAAASGNRPVDNSAAKAISSGSAQFRTLELRELRKFESLTAFGQNLSEIALDTAEWSPQRRPNKTDSKGHASSPPPIVDAKDERNRLAATAVAAAGYQLEKPAAVPIRPPTTHGILLEETQHEVYLYRDNFLQFNEKEQLLTIELEHYHWLGVMTLPATDGANKREKRQEPIAITISQQDYFGLGRFIGIVRTVRSDHAFSLESSLLGKRAQAPKPKDLLQAMCKINPTIKDAKLWLVDDPRVCERLLVFEDVMKYWNYKFGVVYCKSGQTKEEDMLGNCDTSPRFERFLALLGERIPLLGWMGYTADLDTKMNASGTHSIFTQWHDFSVMFHVSTLLPFDSREPQQVARKKYIGNDLVTIVFQDGDAVFTPPCIVSNMLHIFVVITPVDVNGAECYKVSIVSKKGVPTFGPALGNSLLFESGPYFREWLLTKLVNGERASLHHPWLSTFIKKTRRGQLDDILKDFVDQNKKKSAILSAAASSIVNSVKSENSSGHDSSIAATAQTVARLKKRTNRSQVQSPQPIGRSHSAAVNSSSSNGSTPDIVEGQGGARFERLDAASVEWVCDSCQKRSAQYKVMIATGATLTVCGPCAESKYGAKPTSSSGQSSIHSSSGSNASLQNISSSPAVVTSTDAGSPGVPRRFDRSNSRSNFERPGTSRDDESSSAGNTMRPIGRAPLPPGESAADKASTINSSGGGKKLEGKSLSSNQLTTSRAHVSLDSAELDGILTALKRDKLRTPLRDSARPIANSGDSPKSVSRSASLRTPGAKDNNNDDSDDDDVAATDTADNTDGFQARLAELDRRIQQLASTQDVSLPPPPSVAAAQLAASTSQKGNKEKETSSSRGSTSKRRSVVLTKDAIAPPLPPDELVPTNVATTVVPPLPPDK